MMSTSNGEVPAALLLAALFLPSTAAANAAAPTTYQTDVDQNQVTVCPWNFDGRGCAAGDTLVRQNTATGETVVVAENCESGQTCRGSDCCYIDTCVSKGTYRYGFADPYMCVSASSQTVYYTEAEVTMEAADCTPNSTESYDNDVVWKGKDRSICSYTAPDTGPGPGDVQSGDDTGPTADVGPSDDAGPVSDAAGGGTGSNSGGGSNGSSADSGGCSTVGGSVGAAGLVFLVNGLFFACGLALMHRRG